MSVTDAPKTRNRRSAAEWDDLCRRVRDDIPSVADAHTWLTGPQRISDTGLLRLIGDLGIIDRSPTRPGRRTPATPNEVADTVQTIFRDGLGVGRGPRINWDFSTLPFVEAVALMMGRRSSLQMSRRTGIQIDRMKRIRRGTYAPTYDEMALIARTLGKQPWYFREVRSAMIAAAVIDALDADHELSARIVQEIAS